MKGNMPDIFCQIINKEIPAKIRYEDGDILAVDDINPKAPVHILIMPKKHIASIAELKEEDRELAGRILLTAQKLAAELKLASFRLVTNSGEEAGQSVPHLHFHLLGGKELGDIA